MSFYGWKPYVSVAERRKKAEKAAARARKGGRRSLARGSLSWRYRQDFLGQGVVPQSGVLQRLCQPLAARTHLCAQRFGDRPQDHKRRSARQGHGVESLQCQRHCRCRSPEAVAVHQRRLRGLDRFAGRTSARPTFQRRDGTNLQAEYRPLPCAEGNSIQLQLPGLGFHVQARRRCALWCGRAP